MALIALGSAKERGGLGDGPARRAASADRRAARASIRAARAAQASSRGTPASQAGRAAYDNRRATPTSPQLSSPRKHFKKPTRQPLEQVQAFREICLEGPLFNGGKGA